MTTRLACTLILLLSTAAHGLAQPSGRDELRQALREYYAHLLTERLELSSAQVAKLGPRIDAVVSAQHEGLAEAMRAHRRLRAVLADEEPSADEVAPLLRRALDAEAAGFERGAAARESFLDGLDARQQATYLVFENAYREQVVRHVRSLRGGGRARPGASAPDADSPWRRPPNADQRPAPGSERPSQREDQLVENLTLLLAFQARQHLGLDNAAVLGLLPELEASVEAQVGLARLDRESRAGLRASLDSGAGARELKAAVRSLLDEQAERQGRLIATREAVVARLEPVEAARFVVLQERFRREAPRRLRFLERALSGPGEGSGLERPEGAGPARPRFRPRQR